MIQADHSQGRCLTMPMQSSVSLSLPKALHSTECLFVHIIQCQCGLLRALLIVLQADSKKNNKLYSNFITYWLKDVLYFKKLFF